LQISNLVFGVEADYDYLGLRGNATSSALYPCCAPTGFTVNSSAHANWLVTARPRLGYAYDNWLFLYRAVSPPPTSTPACHRQQQRR
jgi:outer membrane immunogenic protein